MNYTKTYEVRVPIKTICSYKIMKITTTETDPEFIMNEAIKKLYDEVGEHDTLKEEACIVNVDILEDNDTKEFIERV